MSLHFSRIDSRSPIVTWSLAGICAGLLCLLIVDARLVAQYLVTMFLAVLTAGIAIVGVGRFRGNAIARRRMRTERDPA